MRWPESKHGPRGRCVQLAAAQLAFLVWTFSCTWCCGAVALQEVEALKRTPGTRLETKDQSAKIGTLKKSCETLASFCQQSGSLRRLFWHRFYGTIALDSLQTREVNRFQCFKRNLSPANCILLAAMNRSWKTSKAHQPSAPSIRLPRLQKAPH